MAKKKKVWTKEAFAKNELRKSFKRWHGYYECKKAARVARGKYKCANCGNLFKEDEMQVDHREPVTPVDKAAKDQSLDEYANRLLLEVEELDFLCKEVCHASKTQIENVQRVENRKKRKAKK